MLLYVLATLCVAATAAMIASAWPGLRGALDRALAWGLVVPALITAVALILGLTGLLTPTAMLVGHGLLLLITAAVAWRKGVRPHLPRLRRRLSLRRPWRWALALGGAATLGWFIYAGLLVPPFAWDALSYHLPAAVWWLQAGKIYSVPTQFTFGYGYPQGWSILLLWQLAFTKTDHLVNLVQVPFILLGVAAAYGIAREAGVGKPWAFWAGAFWGLTPIVLEQAVVPYNDISVTALTLAAAYLLLRYRRSGHPGPLWLAGVALGLILGIKPNGFLVAGLIGLAALLPAKRLTYSVRSVAGRVLALAAPALLLAGYWYLRNLVLYHNPLFPARVSLLGHTIFPGPSTIAQLINVTPNQGRWQTFRMALHEVTNWYSYDNPNAGFGPVFTMIGLGAMAAAGLYALLRKRWQLLLILVAGPLLLVLQPFKYPRYVAFLPALAGLAFAVVLQRLAPRRLRWVLEVAATVVLLFGLVLVPYQPQLSAETFQQVWTARAEGRSIPSSQFGLARQYGFVDTMPELQDPSNRIAYAWGPFVYPLMGQDRTNQVYYVPATSMEQWLQGLQERKTTLLIVAFGKQPETGWVQQNPDRFVLWRTSWPFAIYEVKGGGTP